MTTAGGSVPPVGSEPPEARPPQPAPGWVVEVRGDASAPRRVAESLLTVADGLVGTRGTREEDGPGTTPLVMTAGAYRPGPSGPEPLPGPLWFQQAIAPDDPVLETRWLDLRTGVLHRTGPGLHSQRFACLARPGTLVQRVEVDVPLQRSSLLEAPHATTGTTSRTWDEDDHTFVAVEALGGITAVATEDRTDNGLVADRIAVVHADPAGAPPPDTARDRSATARALGVEGLLEEQHATWQARWADADVRIDGDEELQRAVRFALFHLMASVADTGEAVVGARGLSGPAYAGHVFWDADVHVLPFLAATHPAASRAMLRYRIRRLGAARERARDEGRRGVRFPWESAHDGSEVTPTAYTGLDGSTIPIRTGEQEIHITGDVAWAAWHHVLWSGEEDLWSGPGRRLLVDAAAWWASRIEVDPDGSGHLRGVIGPDEYHEDVDDNAYTNGMAAWSLRRAADLLDREGLTPAEAGRWRHLADALVTGRRAEGTGHEQFAGFDDLEEVDLSTLATPPFAADVLLGHDRVGATQVIKQADVLMLHHLVPEALPAGTLAADLAHYLPRTSHGSSLSPGIHASLLARAGRADEAAHWLRMAARIDLEDLTGTTAGGLHLAAMGTVWQALVFGFLGARPRPDALQVDPRPLPTGWQRLAVRLRFRGHRLGLELDGHLLRIDADGPAPVTTPDHSEPLTAPLVLVHRDGTWHPEDHHAT